MKRSREPESTNYDDIDIEEELFKLEPESQPSANEDISTYSDKYFGPIGYGREMDKEVNKRGYPLGAYDIFGVHGYGSRMEREIEKRKKANTPPPDFKPLGFNALQKENIHTGEHLRIESPLVLKGKEVGGRRKRRSRRNKRKSRSNKRSSKGRSKKSIRRRRR